MGKYKLIKEYSGSPSLNVEIIKSGDESSDELVLNQNHN